jgi:hypothetical protein
MLWKFAVSRWRGVDREGKSITVKMCEYNMEVLIGYFPHRKTDFNT